MTKVFLCPRCNDTAVNQGHSIGVANLSLNWEADGWLYLCPNGHVTLSFEQSNSDVLMNNLSAQVPKEVA